jgi:predicted Zn-dependent peptidase
LPGEHRLTTLDSGVRVVTERMESVRSVAAGIWIGTGSALEDEREAGLSHLLEHMLFRGTERFGSGEIDRRFDAMGADLNAVTGKETTSVGARVLDRDLPEAFDVMADMVWRPSLAEEDLAQEREIVLEELAMYEDDPQDKVFDELSEAIFGGHPLGRPVLGRRTVVEGARADALRGFHAARYVPGRVVVAAAGAVDHDALCALVRDAGIDRAGVEGPPAPPPPAAAALPALRFLRKDTEQVHVCLGAPGLARDDDRRFALHVLDALLGGTPSSRLFQEVREKRGLAYSVFTFQSAWSRVGQVGLYVGTRPDNVAPTLGVVAAELERIRTDGPDAAELERAIKHVVGATVLGLESTSARAQRLGATVLAEMPLLSLDELEARYRAVTAEDVHGLAVELLDPARLSAAAVGPDEAAFRTAVAPALAGAEVVA